MSKNIKLKIVQEGEKQTGVSDRDEAFHVDGLDMLDVELGTITPGIKSFYSYLLKIAEKVCTKHIRMCNIVTDCRVFFIYVFFY